MRELHNPTHLFRHPKLLLQFFQLVERKQTPLTGTEAFRRDASVTQASQPFDWSSSVFTETPHLSVPALDDRHLKPGLLSLTAENSHRRRLRLLPFDRNALSPFLEALFIKCLGDLRGVHLRSLTPCVLKSLSKIAIVGEEQCPARIKVEPSYRDHAHTDLFENVKRRGTTFRVGKRCHHSARLVKYAVAKRFGLQLSAVEFDRAFARIRLGP
jgi:hypothetical protein